MLSYGQLADKAATLPVPEKVALKDPKDWKLIGTSAKRLDSPAKVNGSAKFGIDTVLPGMRFADGRGLTGVRRHACERRRQQGDGGEGRLQGRAPRQRRRRHREQHLGGAAGPRGTRHPVEQRTRTPHLSTADVVKQLEAESARPGKVARKDGDVAAAMAGAATKVEAIYEAPFLAHATMEPVNCTVHVRADGCDVWVGTQVAGARAGRPPRRSPGSRRTRCGCTTT